jgi:hypothetical protein
MDAAWHSTTYGGYDELPENQIPPAPSAADLARLTAAAQSPTYSSSSSSRSGGASMGRAPLLLTEQNSQRRPAAKPVVSRAAAAQRPQQREQKVRTLNVAMHGLEALTALHKITKGEG